MMCEQSTSNFNTFTVLQCKLWYSFVSRVYIVKYVHMKRVGHFGVDCWFLSLSVFVLCLHEIS